MHQKSNSSCAMPSKIYSDFNPINDYGFGPSNLIGKVYTPRNNSSALTAPGYGELQMNSNSVATGIELNPFDCLPNVTRFGLSPINPALLNATNNDPCPIDLTTRVSRYESAHTSSLAPRANLFKLQHSDSFYIDACYKSPLDNSLPGWDSKSTIERRPSKKQVDKKEKYQIKTDSLTNNIHPKNPPKHFKDMICKMVTELDRIDESKNEQLKHKMVAKCCKNIRQNPFLQNALRHQDQVTVNKLKTLFAEIEQTKQDNEEKYEYDEQKLIEAER